MKPIIEIRNLTKTYKSDSGTITALSDINLTIGEGDIYGIIGLSGAGKSTLIRCMNLLEKPTCGEVLFDGTDLISLDKKGLLKARRKIGMIFQSFNLLEQRNCLKNVCFPLEIAGVDRKTAEKRASELLKTVGLEGREKFYPSQLSGGQKQRVAIARALASDPKVLLCDEATSALDPSTTQSVLKLLKEINKTLGVTIVIITHEMKVVESICNKVAIIDNSKIVTDGNLVDVFLSPKTEIAKRLVYSGHISTELSDDEFIKIKFDGQVDSPIISNIISDLNITVSILYAESKVIDGKRYGQIIFKLPRFEQDIEKLEKYLVLNDIKYEVSKDYGFLSNS